MPKVSYAHEINLRDNEPVSSRARRLAYSQRAEIDKQIDNLLEKGYIEPTNFNYAALIVPVTKKDGSLRICIEYRALNQKTHTLQFPV